MTTNRKKSPLEHLFDTEIQKAAKTLISAVREILDDDPAQPAETPRTPPTGNVVDRVVAHNVLRNAENRVIGSLADYFNGGNLTQVQYDELLSQIHDDFDDAVAERPYY